VRTVGGIYTCALCGGALDIRDLHDVRYGAKVRTMIVGRSGEPNERVVYLRGKEIHRCKLTGHRAD
jgi:hypothetical protein